MAVNCAGLYADEVARMAGDDSFAIYPRKGEFFVFDPPDGEPLERILLPVPTKRTKGVLVFPTLDGKIVAGPTAHDGEDKGDWSVRPEAAGEVLPKARAMLPALEGAEPIAEYAGLRPAGRGVNYVIGASAACPGLVNVAAIRSTGLSASLGIAEHVLGLVEEQGVQLGRERELKAEPPPAARAVVDAQRAPQRGDRVSGLLLGVDEGTTGVKAVLFDERLQPVREARRDKVNRHPRPGWVEQDGEEVLAAVVEAVAELLEDPPGDVVACGLDHQGESVLAWDAESGKPLTPIVVWQDKRSQEVLDRLSESEPEVKERSGLPFDPYFSAAKLAWLLEHDEGVTRAREAGTLRMGTVDSFLCDRLGAGFATDAVHRLAHPAARARHARLRPVAVRDASACRPRCCPRSATASGELGTLRHPSWPAELPLTGQVGGPAGGARGRGLRGARAGQGHLRHGRVRARPRGRRGAAGGRRPAAHRGLEHRRARWSTRSTVACSRRARCSSGCAARWAWRRTRRRSARWRARRRTRRARWCCRRWPGIGAPWWKPEARAVLAGPARRHHGRERGAGGAGGDRLAGGGHRRRREGDRGGGAPCGWTAA